MQQPWSGRWSTLPVSALALTVTLWSALLLVILGRVLIWPGVHSVYPIYAQAGHDWRTGVNVYTTGRDLECFRYAPVVAGLFAPLSLLPPRLGQALWCLVSATVYLAGLLCWHRVLASRISRRPFAEIHATFSWVPYVFLLLVLPLSLHNLNNGQCNPVLVGLILAALAHVAAKRWTWVSVLLGIACLFKVYPIALALILVALYPRQLAGRLALTLACGLVMPFLWQRPDYVLEQYRNWFHHLTGTDRQVLPLWLTYRDLRFLFRVWARPIDLKTYTWIEMAVGLAIAATCLRFQRLSDRRRDAETETLSAALALGCCWMTVFGPATESCTYIWLAPSLAWALLRAGEENRPRVLCMLACCYVALAYLQIPLALPGAGHLSLLGIEPVMALIFFGWLMFSVLQRHRDRHSPIFV